VAEGYSVRGSLVDCLRGGCGEWEGVGRLQGYHGQGDQQASECLGGGFGGGGGWDAWGGGKGQGYDGGWGGDKGGWGGDKGGNGWGGGFAGGKGKGFEEGKGKGKGKISQRIASGEPICFGTVKSFQPEKKHGYVFCEQVFNNSGQDVYVFQDVLEKGMAGPGDLIAFFVHWSAKGQPQVSNPLLRLSASEGGFALKGIFKPGKDGTFGFVQCDETKEICGRDVYVRQELVQAGSFEAGQTVKFNVFLNAQNQPNAEAIEACAEDWVPEPADLTVAGYADVKGGVKGKGKAGGDAWGKGGDPWGKGGDPWGKGGWGGWGGDKGGFGKGCKGKGGGGGGGPPTATGKICVGTVKSFNEASNFGFIECDEIKQEYGNDVFVHGRNFTHLQISVGQCLQFEVGVSSKGQPQALNVQPIDDASAAIMSEAAISEAAIAAGVGEPDVKRARTDGEAPVSNAWTEANDAVEWAKQALLEGAPVPW